MSLSLTCNLALTSAQGPGETESFLFDDAGLGIQSKAVESIVSPMTLRLCHLLVSVERKDVKDEAFASLEKTAEELAAASEEFVQAAKRLAEDSEERWLREEMGPVAESLMVSGRNIVLVAQKLHLQPGRQCHREELVAAARQILVDTTKVLLLEDAAAARRTVLAAGRCLACLDALEEARDAASLRCALAALAAALPPLGHLLRGCHLGPPRDPRDVSAVLRERLGELLARLEPRAAAPTAGALTRRLRQLRQVLATPGPRGLRHGRLDVPLAAVLWHCVRLAARSAPPERLRLLARCARLLELRGACARGPRGTGQGRPEPGEDRAALLRAATEALAQGVRSGLLRQILDTFTDTHGPLQRLVQAALATPAVGALYDGEDSWKSLGLALAAFQDQAQQMVRVSHLALACCSGPQTGRDMEVAVAGLWGLAVQVHQLFSQNPQGSGPECSPATLQALLQAWGCACERLLACFDDVLHIPEFLSVSVQEMGKLLDSIRGAVRSGDAREVSRPVAYLQGRATHIVQVMSRYMSRSRDPIFRNGLRVLIRQLEQSSSILGAAVRCSSGVSISHDTDVVLTMAKHLICSAQKVRDGLDGTNHPEILSPLRDQVPRFDVAKGQSYVVLPSLQGAASPERKFQRVPGLGESDPDMSCSPRGRPDTGTQSRGVPLSATSKLILAAESQGHQAVTSLCTNVLEQEAVVDAGQETLAGEGLLGSERMTRLQETWTQPLSSIDPAREMAHRTTARSDRLVEVALPLSGRTSETKQGLVAMVGDWYPLCQQLFCHIPKSDLPGSTAVFAELQQNLASLVQLAAKRGPVDLEEKDPGSVGLPEVLLQMQGRLEEAEIQARQLLDQVLALDGLQTSKSWEESLENGCLLWSVSVQDLIQNMERLSRRQGLFLLPLRQAVRDQQGLQEGLAQATDVSQRLQEAARLSSLLCGDEQVKGEVSFLCREVQVLRDALLDVAQILGSSPKPSPSLSTRFDLLCMELALRARALTDHLSSINVDYERAFQHAVCRGLSVGKNPQARPENSLERMVSGIQAVQGIVARGPESGSCQEDLLVALESILILTREVAQRVSVLQECPEEWGGHMLDWLCWQWAARAHHAVAQLRAWKGGQSKAWRLLDQCLKSKEEPAEAPELDLVQPQLHFEEGVAGTTAGGSVASQGAACRATPGSSVGTSTAKPAIAGPTTAAMGTRNSPPGCPRPHAELDQRVQEDGGADGESRIAQLTREMAKEVFLMAQSLKRRGRVLTKDQLITSARKIATSGHDFCRLVGIIAKNCTDPRCSQELFCAVDQTQTLSSQLRVISSVKASLARSRSSDELLVGSAQRLLQAVFRTLRAAEAASLRGLREPSADLEEQEIAALCMQWRRKLLRRRRQGTSNVDCDELGLQKTSTKKPPALTALVQEAL